MSSLLSKQSRVAGRLWSLAVAVAVVGCTGFGAAAADRASFSFSDDGGYQRIVIDFETLPVYDIKANDSVLIISFDQPIDPGDAFKGLDKQKFIVAGRLDPDGKAVRLALAQKLSVNTIEAGEKLFIDLLPEDWQGGPPGLPRRVIAELAERARKAEEEKRRAAVLRAAEEKNRKVLVRIGENPTFTRITFDWPAPPVADLSRTGNEVTIKFDRIATPMMGRLKADPPRFVDATDFSVDETGLSVSLKVAPALDVRAFREGNSYVVDIADPLGIGLAGDVAERLAELRGDDSAGRRGKTEVMAPRRKGPGAAAEGGAAEGGAAGSSDEDPLAFGTTPSPAREDGPEELPQVIITERPLDRNGDPVPEGAEPVAAKAGTAVAEGGAAAPAGQAETSGSKTEAAPPPSAEEVAKAQALAEQARESARNAEVLKDDPEALRFSFSKETAGAVFLRGDALWLVFDTDERPDLGQFTYSSADVFGTPRLLRSDVLQVVRVPLRSEAHFIASAEGKRWTVGLAAEGSDEAKAVHLVPSLRGEGVFNVRARIASANQVHWIDDPVVGDQIAVVTVKGNAGASGKAREFVEFAALESAAGLAFKTYSDDVEVRLFDDDLQISRQDGLNLSAATSIESRRKTAADEQAVSGLIDFAKWSMDDPDRFLERMEKLEQGVAMLPKVQAVVLRRELIQLYLANELAVEALGELELMARDDPDAGKKASFFAMRGVANVMLYRPKEARRDLERQGVIDEPTIMLWRAYLEAQSENWSEAATAFRKAEKVIAAYPDDLQVRFRLAAARAAVETGKWKRADRYLKALPDGDIGAAAEADAMVLRARILEGIGRAPEALVAFRKVMESGDRRAEAEATYHYATLALRLGDISPERAIDRYEAAAIMWRGDSLELKVLRKLAKLYVAQEDYRRGLEIMKMAVTNFPNRPLVRDIHDDMNEVFRKLYLNGEADKMSPIKALSLYYDFRELTPIGRLGDEMIRKLADRLIAVDLLDKAAEILSHQIEKRLTGAARAQVAAKLAAVHMMNRDPQAALEVIRRTRQAVLPQDLLLRRRLLEARAMTEVGLAQQAVDLLADFTGPDVERVKANALWRSEKWQPAGESYERLLADAEARDGPLTEDERVDAMRAAIAYSLADDKFGLNRLREKFTDKIAMSPDASAFEAVTHTIDRRTLQFRNLAKAVASIDTLDRFLTDFRKSLDELGEIGAEKAAGS